MTPFLLAVALLVVGGLLARATQSLPRMSGRIAASSAVVACVLGLVPALRVLAGAPTLTMRADWSVPFGEFHLAVDPLSAFFLVPLFVLSLLAAVYGAGYMDAYRDKRPTGASWLFFHLLIASMALVIVARNGVLFLVAWEAMSLASYFLVTFEDEREEVRSAGWTYLVATHLGTAFLFALFVVLGRSSGTLDFDKFTPGAHAGALFLLALVGFGTKAGLLPLHVWLPEAHPAAPSHVSALMSGVMIKVGIYGLVRTLGWLGAPDAWWGVTLLGVGVLSGVLGILNAVAQRDVKRLLAYSSVENVGIVAMGLGLMLLARTLPTGTVAEEAFAQTICTVGAAGALLHVLNHSLMKGVLFLGAGSLLHATGTRDLDRMGGLLKKMPWTGTTFLVGAAAISALPPLNGFAGEFLIYYGLLQAGAKASVGVAVPALLAVAALALVGALAAYAFLKAFGVAFLGSPRGTEAEHAHEAPASMRWPMAILAGACVAVGLTAPLLADRLAPVIAVPTGIAVGQARAPLSKGTAALAKATAAGLGLLAVVGALVAVRRRLLAGRTVTEAPTWGCGYLYPTPRMQYTASSFAQPATGFYQMLLGTRTRVEPPVGPFPKAATFSSETPDAVREKGYEPIFAAIESSLGRFRWLQHGGVHLYVLYIALTLMALLVWRLR